MSLNEQEFMDTIRELAELADSLLVTYAYGGQVSDSLARMGELIAALKATDKLDNPAAP